MQTTRVCSVSKTFECQLQEYVIKAGGISLKMLMSHLQDASKSSRDEIDESTECCSSSIPHNSRSKYFIVFFQIFQSSQLNRAYRVNVYFLGLGEIWYVRKNGIKYGELQNKIRLFHMLQPRIEAGPCKQNALHVTNKNVLHNQRVSNKLEIYCTIIIFLFFIYTFLDHWHTHEFFIEILSFNRLKRQRGWSNIFNVFVSNDATRASRASRIRHLRTHTCASSVVVEEICNSAKNLATKKFASARVFQ